MKLTVTLSDGERKIEFDEAYGRRTLNVDGQPMELTLLRVDGDRIRFTVNDMPVDATISGQPPDLVVDAGFGPVSVRVEESRYAEVRKISGQDAARKHTPDLKAPMPGLVTRILVAQGDRVASGTPLVVMEAMKMENELRAQGDGVVDSIRVQTRQPVEQGQLLVTFRAVDEEAAS